MELTVAEQSAELLDRFRTSLPPKPRGDVTAVDLEREHCAKLAELMGSAVITEAIRQRQAL